MRKMVGRNKRKQNTEDIGICFEPLEPRVLLSGSWGAAVASPSPDLNPYTQGDFTQETAALFETTGTCGMTPCIKNKANRKPERLSIYWPWRGQ